MLPIGNSDADIVLTVVATTVDLNGDENTLTEDVTFQIDAVADDPILVVQPTGGAIDADVSIGQAIEVRLFDDDGS